MYDVQRLQVQHAAIIDGKRIVRSMDRPFFYEAYVLR